MPGARRSTIYLDPELHRQLRRISAEDERTVSEMVNVAVAAYLDAGAPAGANGAHGPGADAAGAAGAAGATGVAGAGRAEGGAAHAGERAVGRAVGAAAAGGEAPVFDLTPLVLPPGWSAPAAAVPEGLAPPVRRLFGALRAADPEVAVLRTIAATEAGA